MASSSSSGGVVSAASIAPGAFSRPPAQAAGTAGRADDLKYDLGHLMACDTHPYDVEGAAHCPEGAEAFLRAQSRGNVQLLLNRVFNLPETRTDRGTLAVELPAPKTVLPREKPAPKPRTATAWQKFAQRKGISSRKKSRMVHDDVSRLDREAHEAGVVVRDLRDGRPFGPGEGLIGHEPVRAVDQT